MDLKAAYISLQNPDITKRDYDAATLALSNKVKEIWAYICDKSERFWFEMCDGETTDPNLSYAIIHDFVSISDGGTNYSEFTTEVDGYIEHNNPHYKYSDGFPTEFLWSDDWKSVVDKHIADAIETYTVERREKLVRKKANKIINQAKQKELRKKNKEIYDSVLLKTQSTLTEEEYKFLVENLRTVENPNKW